MLSHPSFIPPSCAGNHSEPVLRWWFRYRESYNAGPVCHAHVALINEDFILNTFSVLGAALYMLHRMKGSGKFIQKYERNK
jgi:hypothetical protein